ncbi:MAG: MFS transporter [Dehalococcoidales bacterium]|nr:MAG: MFS transporter [Dehalococcoidales bacterium]
MQSENSVGDKTSFASRIPFFYGWIIVAVLIASGFIMMGVNSTFGVFFNSLADEFGLTRASTSAILSVRMVFSAIACLLAGWAIDRYGPRKVFSVMGLFVGLSMVLTGLTTSSWQIYITYGLFMSFGAGAVYVVITATVLHWFDRKRGLAIGLTGSGGGIGIAVLSPLSASLIGALGWRNTMLLLGGISWFVMILPAQLLKKDPGNVGEFPDGDPEAVRSHGTTTEIEPLKVRRLFTDINFWSVFFIWLFMAFSMFFVMTHIVPHTVDIGFSEVEAATILSLSGIAQVIGRLSSGVLSDKISARGIAIVSSALQFAAILSLVWIRELWMLYLYGFINGITFASFGTSITVLIGRIFTLNDIGKVLGILEIGIYVGGAIGPYLGGLIFDSSGNYNLAFVIMSAAVLVRIILVLLLRVRPTRQFV